MSVNIEVPRLAESISEAVLVEWLRENGAAVRADEPVATLETDKAAVEIAAPAAGRLSHSRKAGDTVLVGDILGAVEPGAAGTEAPRAANGPAAGAAPVAPSGPAPLATAPTPPQVVPPMGPAVRKLANEHGIDPATITGTGPGGRVLKEDVQRRVDMAPPAPPASPAQGAPTADASPAPPAATRAVTPPAAAPGFDAGDERIVPMSRIRQRIAERLVRAQHTAAILTTFNEVDMSAVLDLRSRYKEAFEKKHGVKLGFMGLFGRACTQALADVPEINAEIRGTDIVYKRHVHLGVAVGTERGLVVPVLKRADTLSLAELEREIGRLAVKGREGTLTIDELSGGTFTISNGGVYGSLLSTPILNPPQSGILGMHKIEKRPVVVNDSIVIRPMMYLAVSYDHRIVDGEQAVTFLVRVKERLEDPERMLLEV
ncbi:MAG: 2-oxoglutarate dehydrogenase complex dihydrolipoyllysine-residue succinyltransferase [Candidatus Eisenbacteria bacterium]